jgi:hypothetical protein
MVINAEKRRKTVQNISHSLWGAKLLHFSVFERQTVTLLSGLSSVRTQVHFCFFFSAIISLSLAVIGEEPRGKRCQVLLATLKASPAVTSR